MVETKKWSGKTGGATWMQKSLILLFRWINIRFLYAVMSIVILFYMLFNRAGYLSQYNFFHKILKYPVIKSFCHVYLNHYKFGQIILDRFAVYAGCKYEFSIIGNEHFVELVNGHDAFLMLSSHVGNYELCGYHLKVDKKKMYALVYAGETETVMQNRVSMFAGKNINMIPVKADMSHLFAVNSALSDGDIVSMPGDRCVGSQKVVNCKFFGRDAKFPCGPFVTALQRELPVLPIFVMKEGVKRYSIYVYRIDSPAVGSRIEKMEKMAQEFASILESVVSKYPAQWFNYYDFWQ